MDALKGIAGSVFASIPVALAFAYIYRLPIPLGGYIGPFGAINTYSINFIDVLTSVFSAWLFYGMSGGFIILPLVGAITGIIVGRNYKGSKAKNKMIIGLAAVVSVAPVFILSIMDYIIGPW